MQLHVSNPLDYFILMNIKLFSFLSTFFFKFSKSNSLSSIEVMKCAFLFLLVYCNFIFYNETTWISSLVIANIAIPMHNIHVYVKILKFMNSY
jgi:hypothetical protein